MSSIIREGRVIQHNGVRTEEGKRAAGMVDPVKVPEAGAKAPMQPNDDPASATYGKGQVAPDTELARIADVVHNDTDGAVTAKNVGVVAHAQGVSLETRGGSEPVGATDEADAMDAETDETDEADAGEGAGEGEETDPAAA